MAACIAPLSLRSGHRRGNPLRRLHPRPVDAIEQRAAALGGPVLEQGERDVIISVLRSLAAKLDPRRYNGAALLGLRGLVFKSHGSADAFAFGCAIAGMKGVVVMPGYVNIGAWVGSGTMVDTGTEYGFTRASNSSSESRSGRLSTTARSGSGSPTRASRAASSGTARSSFTSTTRAATRTPPPSQRTARPSG